MDYRLRIEGGDAALKALRVMEPTVARQVGKDVTKIGLALAAAVRSIAPTEPPVSGWREASGASGSRGGAGWPAWSQVQASYTRRGMTARVRTSSNPTAIASFAESLGRGTEWKTRAGLNLVAYARMRWSPIVKSGRKEGRVARAAIAQEYPEAMRDLQRACDRAVAEVNRRMP